MKRVLVLMVVLLIAVILLIAGFFVYQNYYHTNQQAQNSVPKEMETTNLETYKNEQYAYQINYPKGWAVREFPDTGTGAGFRPDNEPNDLYHEFIAIDGGARPSNYCNIPFNEYVKNYGAAVEIQDYEKLHTLSEITTDSGITGYKTTWKYSTLRGEERISLPITYFPGAENNCSVIRVSLSNVDFMREYDQMLSTFKFVNSAATNTQNTCQANTAPDIKDLTYDDARIKIIAAGWKPFQTRSSISDFPIMTGNITVFWNRGYKELQDCSGTGLGPCLFLFQDSCGNYLHVGTAGIEGADYHALVQAFSVNQLKESF